MLFAEDDPADVELATAELARGGFQPRVDVAHAVAEFTRLLAGAEYDLVLADYSLPGWTGMDALDLVRANAPQTPFIFVTGTMGEDFAVSCLKRGAANYILKRNLARLAPAVAQALEAARLRAERGRQQSQIQRLTVALDQSPASVVVTGPDGRIEYVNRRFTEITGYAPADVLGQTPSLFASGQTPAETYAELWRTIASGSTWSGRLLNRRKSGATYWDHVTISPVTGADGTITHYVATQEDITARLASDQALRESEARFRTLIEASFGGVNMVVDGVICDANPGFAALFGYAREEVLGKQATDFVAPESVAEIRERHGSRAEGTFEIVGLHRDGRRLQIETTVRNYEVDGRPARISAVRDISDRQQIEEEFRRAQRMEAVGRLAGGIAHDFSNYLTVVSAHLEYLLHEVDAQSEHHGELIKILNATDGAAELTRQLLTISRQERVEPQPVLLEDAVQSATTMLRRVIGEDIQLTLRLHEPSSLLMIDPGQLDQVILNLAVNARDAMPAGGALSIETGATEFADGAAPEELRAGRYASLVIRDEGTGMSEAVRSRIFEPFFTTKPSGKGTGLGLATVYGIVKQNGGAISVRSAPTEGSAFTIHLPLAHRAATPTPARSMRAVNPADHGTEVVLLVEDDSAVRRAAQLMLQRFGYTVLAAEAGANALDTAARCDGPIHLLITDLVMPEMSGQELAERLKRIRPDVRTLFISGYSDDAVQRLEVIGPDDPYLQKPFSPATLARSVRQVLDGVPFASR